MSINSSQYFSTVPQINCPRSFFDRSFSHKFTMNCDYLYPFFIDECLPGDSFKVNFQVFGRLENPLIRPVMDELYFETLWFKIPNRLVWSHWVNFCGEQDNPDDTTDYLIPKIDLNYDKLGVETQLWSTQSIFDIFGIPPVGHYDLINEKFVYDYIQINSLPLRSYNLVFNQWFRDENLQNSVVVPMGDSDDASNYTLLKSNKSHDYFTSCLPFAQKGDPVNIPFTINGTGLTATGPFNLLTSWTTEGVTNTYNYDLSVNSTMRTCGSSSNEATARLGINYAPSTSLPQNFPSGVKNDLYYNSGLSIDQNQFQGITVNDFRFAMALQTKRERDARGGTRYIEWIKSQFDVDSPDARLQRTEFLGSTRSPIDINTVVQTSSTDTNSPQGNVCAYGVLSNFQSVVSTSFTEHSYLLGLCRVRHNPVYQQGLSRLWRRSELLDFYIPAFVGLGEQPVYNYEIYAQGDDVVDENNVPVNNKTFGFQPAWSDYRYALNRISGYLRSGVEHSLDLYHFAEQFTQLPLLNGSFIQSNVPLNSKLALPTDIQENTFPQFVMDVRFLVECARPIPVIDIPAGLHNHL